MSSSDTLKRFQDALKGRRLSGIAAYEINAALCGVGPYRNFCEQDEKMPGIYKDRLQQIVDRMIANVVVASESLLTPHQKAAIQRREGRPVERESSQAQLPEAVSVSGMSQPSGRPRKVLQRALPHSRLEGPAREG